MTVRLSPPESNVSGGRKLKSHKKSKKGCGNCKLRSVKCDETRPSCNRCIAYGVSCSYSPTTDSSLLLLGELTTTISISQTCPYFSDTQSELISKFQNLTVFTVAANGRIPLYQNQIVSLSSKTPCLRLSILALAHLHDLYLSGSWPKQHTTFNSKYYTAALSSFTTALTTAQHYRSTTNAPITPSHQAALWTTGALLGTIAFANIDASSPKSAWPMRFPQPTDLDWLKMSDGKRSIHDLTSPHPPPESEYASLFELYNNTLLPQPSSAPSFDLLPTSLLEYFNVYSPSPTDVIYHPSLRALARIYPFNPSKSFINTILSFWKWTAELSPEFKSLLHAKEPRAMLILVFWWTQIYQCPVWWLTHRAGMEGRSICLFLEMYHVGKDGDGDGHRRLKELVGIVKEVFEEVPPLEERGAYLGTW